MKYLIMILFGGLLSLSVTGAMADDVITMDTSTSSSDTSTPNVFIENAASNPTDAVK